MHEPNSRNPRAAYPAPRTTATIDHSERARIAAHDKRVSTLRAKAALAGWRIDVLPGGIFECWRWSRVRQFDSLDAAEAFIAALQGTRP